jgi:hypothetical protein
MLFKHGSDDISGNGANHNLDYSIPVFRIVGTVQKSACSTDETKILHGGQNFFGLPLPVQSIFILWFVPHFGQTHLTVRLSFNLI